jgi:hypothetical protein
MAFQFTKRLGTGATVTYWKVIAYHYDGKNTIANLAGWLTKDLCDAGADPALVVDSVFPVEAAAPPEGAGVKVRGALQLDGVKLGGEDLMAIGPATFKPLLTADNQGQSALDVVLGSLEDQVLSSDPKFNGAVVAE